MSHDGARSLPAPKRPSEPLPRPARRRPTLTSADGATTLLTYSTLATVDASTGSTLVLDVSGANPQAGAQVIGYTPKATDNDNQLWAFTPAGQLTNRLNGFVLDVFQGNASPDTQLISYPAKTPPASNQQWTLASDGTLTSGLGQLVVGLQSESPGAPALSQAPSGASTQVWQPIPAYPLQAILAQPAVPFPTFSGDQATALADIQAALGFDVRAQYLNLAKSTSTLAAQIDAVPRPGSISAADWDAVVAQLHLEIGMVADVRALFVQYGLFHTALFEDQGARLNALILDVQIEDDANVDALVLTIFESIMYTVISAAEPVGSVLANIMAGALDVGLAAGNLSSSTFQVAVSQLWSTMAAQFEGLLTSMGQTEAALLSDWGKLQAADALIDSTGPDSLAWQPEDTATFITQAGPGYDLWVMQALMPARFEITRWSQVTDPNIAIDECGAPSYAQWAQSVGEGSNLFDVYMVSTSGGTFPSMRAMQTDIWGNGASMQTFFTNGALWPFAVSERGMSSNTLVVTLLNQTGEPLTVTAKVIRGQGRGGATRPLPPWSVPVAFAADFDAGGLAVQLTIVDGSGTTIASFTAHQKNSSYEGTLPWVDGVSQASGYALGFQAASGSFAGNVPGTIVATITST